MTGVDLSPSLPDYTPDQFDALVAGREPSFGEFIGANAAEGWWGSTLGATRLRTEEGGAGARDPEPMTQQQWDESAFWRRNLQWDERMTVGRARAMARTHDDMEYRQRLIQARNAGVFEWAAGFGAQMGGALFDPVNFLPIAGPAARGARFAEGLATPLARAARGAAELLERPGVLGGIARGATEGIAGNALAMPYTYSTLAHYGQDITWDRVVTDLAIGGLIGGGFGAAFGRAGSGRMIEPDPIMATRILDSVANDVAAGRRVEAPTALMRAEIDGAVVRAAPAEASPFLRATDDGAGNVTYRPDLPTRPDGTPLTREEFAAELARRQGTTVEAQRAAAQAADSEAARADKAETLVQWLVRNGGVRDDRGDLHAILGEARRRPGLINRNGMPADIAALKAREAGFFEDARILTNEQGRDIAPDGLSDRQLFDAIDAEMRGLGVRRADSYGIEARPDRLSGERMMADWEAHVDDAFRWYGEALQAEKAIARMAESQRADVMERAAIMEMDGGMSREEATVRAAREAAARPAEPRADADPQLAAATREIEAMRAEGRFSPADDAILKAANDAADEIDALARGMEEAGACALRVMA